MTAFESESVQQAGQVARVSEATLAGDDLIAGQHVKGFVEAWIRIVATWRSHEWKPPGPADRFHVETHILAGTDIFLTSDQALLVMCRRLNDKHGFSIVAMTVEEYLGRVPGRRPHDG